MSAMAACLHFESGETHEKVHAHGISFRCGRNNITLPTEPILRLRTKLA